jgi:hypothetical protein
MAASGAMAHRPVAEAVCSKNAVLRAHRLTALRVACSTRMRRLRQPLRGGQPADLDGRGRRARVPCPSVLRSGVAKLSP